MMLPEETPTQKMSAVEELATVELKLKKAQLARELREMEKTEHEVAEFDNDKANKQMDLKGRGATLADQTNTRARLQAKCAHRMGGSGLAEMYTSTNAARSVWKYVLPTNEMIVGCTRCHKTWYPPLPANYFFDDKGIFLAEAKGGKLDRVKYDAAVAEYREACTFDSGLAVGASFNTFTYTKYGKLNTREKTHEFLKGTISGKL